MVLFLCAPLAAEVFQIEQIQNVAIRKYSSVFCKKKPSFLKCDDCLVTLIDTTERKNTQCSQGMSMTVSPTTVLEMNAGENLMLVFSQRDVQSFK